MLAKLIEERITTNVREHLDYIWQEAKLWHKNKSLNVFSIHKLTTEMNILILE